MSRNAALATGQRMASRDLAGLLILVLPPLFWAGNFVVGRATRFDLPPVTLAFGRWLIAIACLLPFAWPAMRRDLGCYWQHRWRLLGISLTGVAAFNTLVYIGLRSTSAANGLLLNSFIPLLIVLFGALFYGHRLRLVQVLGIALSFSGVLTIILHGEWGRLAALAFSGGDLVIFCAMVCWAFYTLWLRGMPAEIDRVGLMGAQIIVALVVLLPFYLWEYWHGAEPVWNAQSVAALAYVGVFPSVLAFLLYNFGVARVGAARASLFIHLIPVFGVALSALFLRESLHGYHAIGIMAIFVGLGCSSVNRATR